MPAIYESISRVRYVETKVPSLPPKVPSCSSAVPARTSPSQPLSEFRLLNRPPGSFPAGLWQGAKMSAGGFPMVAVIVLLSPLLAGAEGQFFGADGRKIGETPKYLKICHRSDKQLDGCIRSSLEKFMEVVKSDSERLNLPSLDPIELPLVEFQLGSGNVSLHLTFKNFRIKGFKNFTVTSVKSNVIDNKFEISLENPSIGMTAFFSAEGGVYTFPIAGDGDFYLNLTNVSAVLIFRLTTTTLLPGLRFFTVEDSLMDLLSTDIAGHFGESIDGSNAIATTFNAFFNSNAHEIFTLIKPKLSATLAAIFASIADEILSRHPDDVLLPD